MIVLMACNICPYNLFYIDITIDGISLATPLCQVRLNVKSASDYCLNGRILRFTDLCRPNLVVSFPLHLFENNLKASEARLTLLKAVLHLTKFLQGFVPLT